ncbi:hypothetical protein [Marinoscillum furvescens]|uniref:Uncharacterized protein n=1 Tax=Marinoscillum furvescens DSM 4134 TaxID=1122208 RepID=A0A3D9LGQ8_MARFU|nr:hypothetical protein [Marinoscillum furvescens]REE05890.1 hypothetical protein C7460_101409 [Marinoscillum furvescens DSM 4134]
MNDRQTKYLNQYRDILGVLNNYPVETNKYAVIEKAADAFKHNVSQIEEHAKATVVDSTSLSKGKAKLKRELAELAVELAAAAMAYAQEQDNNELKGVFDIHYSDIRYAKDEDALNLSRVLEEELTAHLESLAMYLIMPEDVAKLSELSSKFQDVSELHGGTQAASKRAHKTLNVLFRETQQLLANQLDLLMMRLKRLEPDFAEDYFNARGMSVNVSRSFATEPEPDIQH